MTLAHVCALLLATAAASAAPPALIDPLGTAPGFQQHASWDPDSLTLTIEVGKARGYAINLSARNVDSFRLVPLVVLRDLERIDFTVHEPDTSGILRVTRTVVISGQLAYGGECLTTAAQTADRAILQFKLTPAPGSEGELVGKFAAGRADLNGDGAVNVSDVIHYFVDGEQNENSFSTFLTGRSCPPNQGGGRCPPRMPCFIQACDIFDWNCEP